mmetsp:Transcript_16287/g.15611  ORF Transcript_16287/g.15611 Transcript_16287/m.15611 type:complete len:299 (-) Transcript_16287:212-1108(-)
MSSSKGDSFLAEGEKALKRSTLFGFGKAQKYEDAAEAFTKAGNAFKLANLWESGGKAFLKAAEQQLIMKEVNEAGSRLIEAGNCFKKVNPKEAIKAFNQAIDIYNESGRFSLSSRYYKEIAEIYEADGNMDGAIESFQQAANLFIGDNKQQNANQCLLKIANLSSAADDFSKAGEIFESLGRESMGSRLGAYSAKGHFLQCCLCYLALGDGVAMRAKLDDFKNLDYSFPPSRECDLLEKLLTASDNFNAEEFAQACADFDRISPLDPWKTTVLLKAKRHIDAAAGGGDGDEDEDVDMS